MDTCGKVDESLVNVDSCGGLEQVEKFDEAKSSSQNEMNELGDTLTPNKDIEKMKTPHVGMLFDSLDEAKEYYFEYGRQQGFAARIRSSNKTRFHVDEVTGVKFVCSREGEHKKKNGHDGADETNRSCSTVKCGCKACMRVLYMKKINKWKVTIFSDDHNHKFINLLNRVHMRTNRHMPDAAKILIEAFHRENLQVGKVPSIFGGVNIGFTRRDCWNHLRSVRRRELEMGDAIPSHFTRKRWMRGANEFRVMDGLATKDNHECLEAFRLSHLCRRSTQVWCVASKSDKLYKMAIEGIERLFSQILAEHSKMVTCDNIDKASVLDSKNDEEKKEEDIRTSKSCQLLIQDPHISQTKGRPKDDKGKGKANSTGRFKSSIEVTLSKKRKKCTLCKVEGHNKQKCPKNTNRTLIDLNESSLDDEAIEDLGCDDDGVLKDM